MQSQEDQQGITVNKRTSHKYNKRVFKKVKWEMEINKEDESQMRREYNNKCKQVKRWIPYYDILKSNTRMKLW
jgi:hypothetical protein